jgi:hypothetical protein
MTRREWIERAGLCAMTFALPRLAPAFAYAESHNASLPIRHASREIPDYEEARAKLRHTHRLLNRRAFTDEVCPLVCLTSKEHDASADCDYLAIPGRNDE